jgi:hypothetical protein
VETLNWDAIGAIGEIIGALAVVVSLVYLALQIRSQNAQAKLSSLHDMSRDLRATSAMFATKNISQIFIRANQDYNSLTEAEAVQLVVLVTNLLRAWENAFLENKDGFLERFVWETLSRDYAQGMGSPSFQHIWRLRKQNFDPSFQQYVDNLEISDYIAR